MFFPAISPQFIGSKFPCSWRALLLEFELLHDIFPLCPGTSRQSIQGNEEIDQAEIG